MPSSNFIRFYLASTLFVASSVVPLAAQPFPAQLDLGQLTQDDGIVLLGSTPDDGTGDAIAGIGDVNDDGLADLAIAASDASPNESRAGTVYVVFGNTSVVDPILALDQLNGSNGFRLEGREGQDFAGEDVDGIGDFNGDGIDDFVIGAPGAEGHDGSSGEAYVIYGRPSFPAVVQLRDLDGLDGFQINGESHLDDAGESVSGAGDFNGDGLSDLILGAPSASPNFFGSGKAYLVYGRPMAPARIELSGLSGSDGFELRGITRTDGAGSSVSSVGDVNGDGFSDVLIGAPSASPNGDSSGESYLIFGRAAPFPSRVELADIDGSNGVRLQGRRKNDFTGTSVGPAGDFNRDGFDDFIIGSSGSDQNGHSSGTSYLVYGRSSFPESLSLGDLNGDDGFALQGVAPSNNSGGNVGGGFDFNGDGFEDAIIAAASADLNGEDAGETYVVYGGMSYPVPFELFDLDGTNGLTLVGSEAGDFSGSAVASAGDFNGDGVDDVVVGAKLGNFETGMGHLVFGRSPTGRYLGATGGSCPGTIRLRSRGWSSGSGLALYRGSGRGTTTLVSGACAGTELDLADAELSSDSLVTDGDGLWRITLSLGAETCGTFLQAVGLEDCEVTNVTNIPEE